MPKMLLFAFLISFTVSVANTQEPEIADIDKQIAELDKTIEKLEAAGVKWDLKIRPIKVKQVINKNAAIINVVGMAESLSGPRVAYSEDLYYSGDTEGWIDEGVYKVPIKVSGKTKTYATVGTGTRTIKEIIKQAPGESELLLKAAKEEAAQLSYEKIVEGMKDKPFMLYGLRNRKKVRLHKSKVTLSKIWKRDEAANRGLGESEPAPNQSFGKFAWELKDEDGETVFASYSLHKTTLRKFEPLLEEANAVWDKYGPPPTYPSSELRNSGGFHLGDDF